MVSGLILLCKIIIIYAAHYIASMSFFHYYSFFIVIVVSPPLALQFVFDYFPLIFEFIKSECGSVYVGHVYECVAESALVCNKIHFIPIRNSLSVSLHRQIFARQNTKTLLSQKKKLQKAKKPMYNM